MPIEEVMPGSRALAQLADRLATARKILVVTGAGISTSCGIPDFRSKEGLYELIEDDYVRSMAKQPKIEDASSISRDRKSFPTKTVPCKPSRSIKGRDLFDATIWNSPDTSSVFLKFAASLRRSAYAIPAPSPTHRFLRLLRDQRRLVRVYTQNIDGLEARAGLQVDLAAGSGTRGRFSKAALALPPSVSPNGGKTPAMLLKGSLNGGCEAVQLHGDLASLRCSVCQHLIDWSVGDPADFLLTGNAPECPACAEADAVRRAAGRRGTRVGALRPNVVLYGEPHPAADAIGKLVSADLATGPDLLLVMGTSLKVHGLQALVREMARAVHARRGGRVVFVNRTAPVESKWKDTIDVWVRMDCDAFVQRMRVARPDIAATQVGLPYMVAKSWQKAKGKSDDDKENAVASFEAAPSKDEAPERSVPSTPRKKQRPTLADISSSSQGNALPPTPRSSPARKRKADAFDIYEEGPIVVTPNAKRMWQLKAVEVPSSQSEDDISLIDVKRRKIG